MGSLHSSVHTCRRSTRPQKGQWRGSIEQHAIHHLTPGHRQSLSSLDDNNPPEQIVVGGANRWNAERLKIMALLHAKSQRPANDGCDIGFKQLRY